MVEEWVTSDTFDVTRLNKKTMFVGIESQIALITSPQGGQTAYITADGATYKRDKIIRRNAANTSWTNNKISTLTSSVGVVGTTNASTRNMQNNRVYGVPVTLPTSEKLYIPTSLECYIEGSVNILLGLDIFYTNPGASNHSILAGISQAQSVTLGQRVIPIRANAFRGGTIFYPWGISDVAQTVRGNTESVTRYYKAGTYAGLGTSAKFADNTTVLSDAASGRPYFKVNYTAYY